MLSILNEIEAAKGAAKQNVLRKHADNQDFKTMLNLAYDPYRRFGIQSATYPDHVAPRSYSQRSDQTILMQMKCPFNRDTVEGWLQKLDASQHEWVRRVILKDLRVGVNVTTINKVFPGLVPEFKTMLAQPVDWKRVRYPCWSQAKLDGVRCLVTQDSILTRSGRPVLGCDHVVKSVRDTVVLGRDQAVDGELMIKGQEFDAASGNIRAHGESPDAVFYMFDIGYLDPTLPQWSFEKRNELLETLSGSPHLRTVELRLVHNMEEAKQHFGEMLDAGLEGTILKPLNYRYELKRSYHWMKLKAKVTLDLECVGFYEGEGRLEGMLGGIEVDLNGVTVRVGGGFSDEERQVIWDHQDHYIHKKAEVYAQQKTKAGSLRHPNFLRWRLDL